MSSSDSCLFCFQNPVTSIWQMRWFNSVYWLFLRPENKIEDVSLLGHIYISWNIGWDTYVVLSHLCVFSMFIHTDNLQVLIAWAFKPHRDPLGQHTAFHAPPVYRFNVCWYLITVKTQLCTCSLQDGGHLYLFLLLWAKYDLKRSPCRCSWDSSRTYTSVSLSSITCHATEFGS